MTDAVLARPTLIHSGVLTTAGALATDGAVRIGQAAVLLEADDEAGFLLVLTVPEFLQASLSSYVAQHGDQVRPIDTSRAIRETVAAAGPRLQIAALRSRCSPTRRANARA